MKKIFLVNDDGYKSPGLLALIKALKKEYDLSIVSTTGQRSWTAKSISYRNEVNQEVKKIAGQKVVVLDGLPADCANIGLNHFTKPKADLAVSGINIGANITASWTLSSATVGAALEAAILGYQALAFSQRLLTTEIFNTLTKNPAPSQEKYFRLSTSLGKLIIERVLKHPFPSGIKLLNVNFPPQETYVNKWKLAYPFEWNYGSIFTEIKKGIFKKTGGEVLRQWAITDRNSDVWQINNGLVSITPYTLPLCPALDEKVKKYFQKTFPEYF